MGIEAGVLGSILASQMWQSGPLDFQSKRWALIFWVSCGSLVAGLLMVAWGWLSRKQTRQEIVLPALANGIFVVAAFALSEAAVRVLAQPDPFGSRVGGVLLRPFDWSTYGEHNLTLYQNSLAPDAFYVGHDRLGWTVGPSRSYDDGLYVSSRRGLRSAVQGEDLFNRTHASRIGLFGDSFMFSEEVVYGESLQHHLESAVDGAHQVLSFGVPGYGLDQAVLRYELEVDWEIDIAVLAFIRDDVNRALNVYTGLKPSWGIPFSKGRYLYDGQTWQLHNVPNMPPEAIYRREDPFSLPTIEHDVEFLAHDWEPQMLDWSHLFRYLASVYPPWAEASGSTGEDAFLAIGAFLAGRFMELAQQRQARALLVYLPSRSDFNDRSQQQKRQLLDAMSGSGLTVYDATECLLSHADQDTLYVEGGTHYSDTGNRALSRCLLAELALNR
ncbi:MAG: hypothetical protein QNJ40_19290 [Xanthomonadales bacterium]|nr:hypothetical protein [Xanthomonadales bacterium]